MNGARMTGELEPQLALMKAMKAGDWNKSQLARALDVTPATVSLWARGLRRPTVKAAREVADLLNMSAGDLWTYEAGEPDE